MARGIKYTKEQYEEEFNAMNPNFEIISDFVNLTESIRIKCKLCGKERYSEAKYNLRNHLKCSCNKPKQPPHIKRTESYNVRMTHDEFIQKFNENNSNADTLEILEPFTRMKKSILTKCKVCGYEWKACPSNLLLNNTGCRSCASSKTVSKKKYTIDGVKERLHTLHPKTTIQILELTKRDRPNNRYKEVYCVCRCGICNGEWESRPSDLFKGHGCPHCMKANLVTDHKSFMKKFLENNCHKDEIEILSEYVNSSTRLHCKCKICEYEWDVIPSSLMIGHGCPMCANLIKGKTKTPYDEFISRLQEKDFCKNIVFNKNDYVSLTIPIKFSCKIHNYSWTTQPKQVLNAKYACIHCAREKQSEELTKSHEQFILDLKNKNPYFTVLSEYTNNKSKVFVRCELCKQEYWIKANDLLVRGTCSKCSDGVSYPNKFSYAFLKQLPIENNTHEYSPEWANGRRYDNYFEYQGQAYILEMDGKQHYLKSEYSRFRSLEEQQRIDKLKDDMAHKHGIKIIRINCIDIYKTKIKNEILSSELANIFDLSNIDWNKCDIFARSNLVKSVWDYYNDNPLSLVSDIANEFSLSTGTIQKYLRQGNLLGIVKYSKKDIHARMKQLRELEKIKKGTVT